MSFKGLKLSEDNCSFLKKIIPNLDLNSVTILFFKRTGEEFKLKLWFSPSVMTSVAEMKQFISDFGDHNNCVYVLHHTNKKIDLSYRAIYRCQHSHKKGGNPNLPRKRRSKGTECKSNISFILKKRDWIEDRTEMNMNFHHNHSICLMDAAKYMIPSKEVRNIFKKIFECNWIGPAEALRAYKRHLKRQTLPVVDSGPNILQVTRKILPDYDWVRHFNKKLNLEKFIPNKETIENLQRYIRGINGDILGGFKTLENDNFAVVIITSLMQQTLETKYAAKIVFIDSCGSVEKFGLKVFLIMTKMQGVGVPLGVIITTSETVEVIRESFEFYRTFLNEKSFGGNGPNGPAIIITDDSKVEVSALSQVFTEAKFLICIFRFLQAHYTWLLKWVQTSTKQHELYEDIRGLVYADTKEQFNELYTVLEIKVSKDFNVLKYVHRLYQKHEQWALYCRSTCDSNTNIVEKAVRVLREDVLNRIKARSPNELIDYIINEYTTYYKNRILYHLRLQVEEQQPDEPELENYTISEGQQPYIRFVLNKQKNITYEINTEIGMCSCFVGCAGNLCKHQRLLPEYMTTSDDRELPQNFHESFKVYENSLHELPATFGEEANELYQIEIETMPLEVPLPSDSDEPINDDDIYPPENYRITSKL